MDTRWSAVPDFTKIQTSLTTELVKMATDMLKSSTSSRKVAEITFDKEGDVILVLPSPIALARFLVCSRVLCYASPVFKAMLGKDSCFKEGASLAQASKPVEVVLKEDDPRAFLIILRILHHQQGLIKAEIEEDILYQLAILCDKYDLQPLLGSWFRDRVSRMQDSDLKVLTGSRWLTMSVMFGHTSLFTTLSKEIILRGSMSPSGELVTNWMGPEKRSIDKLLPQAVIGRCNIFIVLSSLQVASDISKGA